MSPVFTPDFGEVRATTRVFDRGTYVVELGKARPIGYEKDDGTVVVGARVPMTIVHQVLGDGSTDDTFAGEDVTPVRCYIHSKGALRMTKRMLMAFYGYDRNSEEEFNNEVLSQADFGVTPPEEEDDEATFTGEGWLAFAGNHVQVLLSTDTYEGEEQQQHGNWAPVS